MLSVEAYSLLMRTNATYYTRVYPSFKDFYTIYQPLKILYTAAADIITCR